MDLLQAIEDILDERIVHKGPLVLSEDDPGSRCKTITLKRRGRAVAIRPDDIERGALGMHDRLFPLFKTGDAGLTRLCDYIVFFRAARDRPYFVFLCELKSSLHTRAKQSAHQQTANGRLLADYVVAMARHHRQVDEDTGALAYRALVFFAGHKNPKGSQRPGKFRYHRVLPSMPEVRLALLGCGTTLELRALCDE